MGPYTFARLRRLIECEAQFLLSDHEVDTPESELQRAGHQAMELFLRTAITVGPEVAARDIMAGVARRVLLADPDATFALREALVGLDAWFDLPPIHEGVSAGESVMINHPIHLALETTRSALGYRAITGSRPATPQEIAAGRHDAGWLYHATLDLALLPPALPRGTSTLPLFVADWDFTRADSFGDRYLRELQAKLLAISAWIAFGSLASTVTVFTVYPMLRGVRKREFGKDDFIYILSDLEGLLLRADDVLDSGPATLKHTRVGARCETCPVTRFCPAADGAVLGARAGVEEWVAHAERWILLRRRLSDLEASLREKTRAEGPIRTTNGYEVGFGGKDKSEFGVWRQRLDDDPLALVDPT